MKDDIDKFIDFWIEKTDEVMISPCRPVGSRENVFVDRSVKRIPCYMLYEMMVVYWDGQVGLCCEDWFNSGNMGDLNRQAIIDVWNGRKFNKARSAHEHEHFHKMPLCKDCNTWFKGVIEDSLDEKRLWHVQKNVWQHIYRKSCANVSEAIPDCKQPL
jgi:radical SAM protein with 4Fe4S-binding SPASM domain